MPDESSPTSLDPKLHPQLQKLLSVQDDAGGKGQRLAEDARRLWSRLLKFLDLNLVETEIDREALELACYGIQLPLRFGRSTPSRRAGQLTLRERCEQAAELLITWLSDNVEEALVDRAARILREAPQRTPMLEESKLLADAINLDDFGVSGAVLLAMQLGRQNAGLLHFLSSFQKRDQYGYWDARLKEGFHYPPIRDLAHSRVARARTVVESLTAELHEDAAL
jgi:hypothetical protein